MTVSKPTDKIFILKSNFFYILLFENLIKHSGLLPFDNKFYHLQSNYSKKKFLFWKNSVKYLNNPYLTSDLPFLLKERISKNIFAKNKLFYV